MRAKRRSSSVSFAFVWSFRPTTAEVEAARWEEGKRKRGRSAASGLGGTSHTEDVSSSRASVVFFSAALPSAPLVPAPSVEGRRFSNGGAALPAPVVVVPTSSRGITGGVVVEGGDSPSSTTAGSREEHNGTAQFSEGGDRGESLPLVVEVFASLAMTFVVGGAASGGCWSDEAFASSFSFSFFA